MAASDGRYRGASVYARGRTFVVSSGSRLRNGYGEFPGPPYEVVAANASDERLGAAVVKAVEAFQLLEAIPSHEVLDAQESELLRLVGVKDRRSFERGASLVSVAERADVWEITPLGRVRGGWEGLAKELTVELSNPSVAEIGSAVRLAHRRAVGQAS